MFNKVKMMFGLIGKTLMNCALFMLQVITFGAIQRTFWQIECIGADGTLKWVEQNWNITVNECLNDILSVYWGGGAQTTAWYVGLKGSGTPAAADTMASHASWSELTPYSNATRPALTLGAVSGQSVDNSASKASFSINATATVNGAFTTSNNTKGGTTGKLGGAVDFSSSRAVADGDTLNVTVTLTQASV